MWAFFCSRRRVVAVGPVTLAAPDPVAPDEVGRDQVAPDEEPAVDIPPAAGPVHVPCPCCYYKALSVPLGDDYFPRTPGWFWDERLLQMAPRTAGPGGMAMHRIRRVGTLRRDLQRSLGSLQRRLGSLQRFQDLGSLQPSLTYSRTITRA